MSDTQYPRFRSCTDIIRNVSRVDEQLDALFEDEGPGGRYEIHNGPTFWADGEGIVRVTVVYKLKEHASSGDPWEY